MTTPPRHGGTRAPATRAEIDLLRSRLLAHSVLLLIAVGAGAVALSYLGADVIAPLRLTPHAARIGFLALLIGFVALTIERDRALKHLSAQAEQREHLLAEAKVQLVAQERASEAYVRAASLVRSRFLQTVSHELRTPLTSIMGYSLTLDKHWERLDDQVKRECARSIGEQGNRLKILVERILEAARVELEGVTMKKVRHDVRRSASRALRYIPPTDAGRIQLAVPSLAVIADLDPFVVEQAILNCVDNALRYTKGPVTVSLDGYRPTVRLVIADEGPGMDAAQLKQITHPLTHPDAVRSGSGLGLHVVKTLVVDHGGRLKISSGPEGTRVEISLPRWVRTEATEPARVSAK